ncbi:hypothetical protein H6P81_017533 [Aristolochia fimbriata]|uniref:Secreted protein n=1 Tax=Aristolochia fimbriata TaxID=158543 RepID=A0AAV7DYQ9_ARIFI|nr:hypothetical protein H6P81_017533 [Aristolochia fimbriata]
MEKQKCRLLVFFQIFCHRGSGPPVWSSGANSDCSKTMLNYSTFPCGKWKQLLTRRMALSSWLTPQTLLFVN